MLLVALQFLLLGKQQLVLLGTLGLVHALCLLHHAVDGSLLQLHLLLHLGKQLIGANVVGGGHQLLVEHRHSLTPFHDLLGVLMGIASHG